MVLWCELAEPTVAGLAAARSCDTQGLFCDRRFQDTANKMNVRAVPHAMKADVWLRESQKVYASQVVEPIRVETSL